MNGITEKEAADEWNLPEKLLKRAFRRFSKRKRFPKNTENRDKPVRFFIANLFERMETINE